MTKFKKRGKAVVQGFDGSDIKPRYGKWFAYWISYQDLRLQDAILRAHIKGGEAEIDAILNN